MTYKKIFSKTYTNNPYTDASIQTEFNDLISEFNLAGIYQTSDVNQASSTTLPALSSLALNITHNLGYLMFKIWDKSYLRLDIIYSKNAVNSGYTTFIPSVGFETDGAGNFIGNSMESKGIGFHPNRSSNSNGTHESVIYKSDNTFWFFYIYNRNTTYLLPACAIFLSKTVDENLVPIDDHILNMISLDNTGGTPIWTSINQSFINVRAISKNAPSPRSNLNPGAYGYGDELFCQVNTFMESREDTDNRFIHRCYQPAIDGYSKVNYDLLAIRTIGIPDLKTVISVQSGGSAPRNFLLFKSGTDPAASSATNVFATNYGSILKPSFTNPNTYGLAFIWD